MFENRVDMKISRWRLMATGGSIKCYHPVTKAALEVKVDSSGPEPGSI
jgi:hypothetical protein